MAKTISELRNQSIQVRDASAAGENTATRVGTVLNDIVGHIEDYENTQSSNNSSQDAKIEGVKSSLNAEIARAKTEESNLSTQIGTERTERQAAVSREETARIQADNDEKTAREQADNAEQDARIKADNDEKTARENADITLRTMIQTEVSNRQIAVKQEEIRAKAAEQANAQAIEDETARAQAAEQANAQAIEDETARAQAAEEANAQAIEDETARAQAAEEANAQAITDEIARAKAAEQAIIFDVSAYNNGAVFESIQTLLSNSNLDILIPVSFRHGGMTIRFIQGSEQNSDNKYVQFRLMSNVWSTTVADWQGIDDKPTAGSDNLVKSGGVANKLAELESNKNIILYGEGETRPSGIKVGDIYYNTADNKLYKIVDSTPDFVVVPFVAGNLYTLNGCIYIYDGYRLVLSSIINIAQIAPSDYVKVPKYGIFYNTSTKLLRRENQSGGFETVPFVENALYSCAGQLYYWNGDDLVTVYSSNKHIAIKSRNTYYKVNDDIQAGDWIIVDFQSSSVLNDRTILHIIKEDGYKVPLISSNIGAGLYAYKVGSKYAAFYFESPNADASADISIIKPYDSVVNYITAHTEHGSFEESDHGFSYDIDYFSNRLRSSYMINVNGAKAIHISGLPNTITFKAIKLYCFKADYTFIAEIDTLVENFTALPDECKYIRFKCNTENDIKSVVITSFYGGEMTEEKNIQYANDSERLIFEIGNNQFTTARLMLPPNYSANGKYCPMILYLQGSDMAVNMNFELGKGVTDGVHYLRDEGYAVLEIWGWGNYYYGKYPNCGHAYPYPTPTGLKCVKYGIEYALSHFNIDKNDLHILSWSQGGQNSLYYVTHNEFNFKTINMIAPVLDYLSMPGGPAYADARKAIAEDLGLESDCVYQGVSFNGVEYFGSTEYRSYYPKARVFFERNIDKMQYLNEAWMRLVGGNALERLHEANDDAEHFWTTRGWEHPEDNSYYNNTDRTFIGEHVSVQMWCAKDDDQTPYRKVEEVSKQLQNGGIECKMNVIADGLGGHYSVAQSLKVPVTTSLGISYTAVPVAFVQTVSFIRSKKW